MVKTPRPNLGAGMQSFLSGYAIWAGRRWRRPGHLFQGRYRAEMIEDESYYWTVSRYIHLNPVRAGLVQRPEQWEWSSYPGYRDAKRAQPWVAHDELLRAWQGDQGGRDARSAYVHFVEAGPGQSAPITVSRRLWRVGSGLRAIPGSTAKPRQFDPVQSSGRGGATARRARPETDLRGRQGLLRPGRGGAVAAPRPPSWRGRSRPGSAAGTPRRRYASSPCGWDFRVPTASPTSPAGSKRD